MAGATYVCAIGCLVDCPHGLPCLIFRVDSEHPHPTKRGRGQHIAADPTTGAMHEWNGDAGRCTITKEEDLDAAPSS